MPNRPNKTRSCQRHGRPLSDWWKQIDNLSNITVPYKKPCTSKWCHFKTKYECVPIPVPKDWWKQIEIQLEACYGSGLRGTTLNKNERVSLICVCQAYLA